MPAIASPARAGHAVADAISLAGTSVQVLEHVLAGEGGTRHPATGFEECPRALVFGIGPLPTEADPFDEANRDGLEVVEADGDDDDDAWSLTGRD